MVFLPGDQKKDKFIKSVIRVNHAGEYGAKQIYSGQIKFSKNTSERKILKHMADQEQQHLDFFSAEMIKQRVRPSLLMPLWHVAGFMLGAGTALLGKNAAMIATEAVEDVIDKHYQEQLKSNQLPQELAEKIEKFRQEEIEHQNIAQNNMQNLNMGHRILSKLIKAGCKLSIFLAKKI